MSIKFRSYVVFFFGALILGGMIPLMYLFRKHHRTVRLWGDRMLVKLMGVKTVIKGTPDPEAMLFVMNHRSMLDIIVMEAVLEGRNPCWIAKQQITDLPYFGHIMKAPQMLSA